MNSSKGVSDSLKDSYLVGRVTRPKTAAGFSRKGISGIKRPSSGKEICHLCLTVLIKENLTYMKDNLFIHFYI